MPFISADDGPAGGDEGSEDVIPWIRLPRPCQNAVKAYKPDIELLLIKKKAEYGTLIYEVEFESKGVYSKIEMTGDGRFLEVEEELNLSQLPPHVRKLIEKKPDDKTELRAKAVILYTYKIEYEDGRPPIHVDATGHPAMIEHDAR